MRYPDNMLARGERVVLHRHPHWKRLVGPVLALFLSTALAAFVAGIVHGTDWEPKAKAVVGAIVVAVWGVIVAGWTVWPLISWRTTHFVITDRRVMFRRGLATRSGFDIPLARINSVAYRHGLVDGILHTGTLIIESASQDPLEMDDVPGVERVHALLYHEVFDTSESEDPPG